MADTKISDLPAVTSTTAGDEFVLARSGDSKKIDSADLLVADQVSFTPAAGLSSTDVQAAIEEVAAGSSAELDYVEFTADVTVSATTEAGANTVVVGNSVVYDGSTAVIVEFFTARMSANGTSATGIVLLQDTTVLGVATTATQTEAPVTVLRRIIPTAGSHTFTVKAYRTTANNIIRAGAGGSGATLPGFIRVYRA